VLRLIDAAVKAAVEAGVDASLCGQMSAEPAYAMLLVGMGLREVSVPPIAIPEIKKVCRNVTIAQCQAVAERALAMESARQVDRFLQDELSRIGASGAESP